MGEHLLDELVELRPFSSDSANCSANREKNEEHTRNNRGTPYRVARTRTSCLFHGSRGDVSGVPGCTGICVQPSFSRWSCTGMRKSVGGEPSASAPPPPCLPFYGKRCGATFPTNVSRVCRKCHNSAILMAAIRIASCRAHTWRKGDQRNEGQLYKVRDTSSDSFPQVWWPR